MPGGVAFDTTIKVWVVASLAAVNLIARDAAIEVANRVIERTPIDESPDADEIVAKGDWNAAIGSIPSDPNQGDRSGEIATAYIEAVAHQWDAMKGQPFVIANHRHYMDRIEYIGWKYTGPYAPMGKTVVEWDDIVQKMVRKHHGAT